MVGWQSFGREVVSCQLSVFRERSRIASEGHESSPPSQVLKLHIPRRVLLAEGHVHRCLAYRRRNGDHHEPFA